MTTFRRLISRVALAFVAIIAVASIAKVELSAQDAPTGYCIPKQWALAKDAMYKYYNCYFDDYIDLYGYQRGPGDAISYIKIYNTASGEVALYKNTGDTPEKGVEGTRCYHFYDLDYEGTKQLAPGETFTLETRIKGWQYAYPGFDYCSYTGTYYQTYFNLRLFIDWNRDADWDDTFKDGNGTNYPEYVKWSSTYVAGSYCQAGVVSFTFKVPDDAEGKTRLRFMACGPYSYYPYAAQRPNACIEGYWYEYYTTGYSYISATVYGETEDYIVEFGGGIKNTFPSDKAPNSILYAGEKYNGELRARKDKPDGPKVDFKRPMYEISSPMKEGTKVSFQIYGPLPLGSDEASKMVYEALDPNSATPTNIIDMSASKWGTQKIFYINKSQGKYSPGSNGAFEAAMGGEYELRTTLYLPGKSPKITKKKFTVAWANDIMAFSIFSPVTDGFPRYYKYPSGMTIPVQGTFTNAGLNIIQKFNANAKITDADGVVVFEKDLVFDPANDENYSDLPSFGSIILDFGSYKPTKVAQYKMVITADLKSASDMETYNNRFPRVDEGNYTFATAYQVDASAHNMIVPADKSADIVAGRPFIPIADLKNGGISDAGNVVVMVKFKHKTLPYSKDVDAIMESLPQGPEGLNTRSIKLPTVTLEKPGLYDAELTIIAPGDQDNSNDKYTFTFEVLDAIGGVFTVGKNGNFETIDDAMQAFYKTGINKPTVLELTDSEYNVGNLTVDEPAWDLSSYIRGVDKNNTFTIRPSAQRAVSKGGVTINLYSKSGVGILLGQSRANKYPTAIINDELQANQVAEFAKSAGYITIDGGTKKSLNFVMHSANPLYSAAFKLQHGVSNIKISNCLINNADNNANLNYIPGTRYELGKGNYFESDYGFGKGYSAGIANRSTILTDFIAVPGQTQDESNFTGVDFAKLPNSNNIFTNNEIKGFGYGILSIGMGPVLFVETDADDNKIESIKETYNENNLIENNIIEASGAAGIFVGYEKDLKINKNVINKVNSQNEAYGIRLGGASHKDNDNKPLVGYNNVNVDVTANSISNLQGNNNVAGILFEQSENAFQVNESIIDYPTMDDDCNLESNAIWNVKAGTVNANIAGITAMKERTNNVTGTVKNPSQVVKGLTLTNNTVNINTNTNADFAGLSVLNINDAVVFNNAISVACTGTGLNQSALSFMGSHPSKGGINSDHNAIYTTGTLDAVRFIETAVMTNDENKQFLTTLHAGWNDEFESLRSWISWSGMDKYSVFGVDFNKDFNFNESNITLKTTPTLSVLSNRGLKLDGSRKDLNGSIRGNSGERFDIGAIEFVGNDKTVDFEASLITSPMAYYDKRGNFNDAEYVMTTTPINVNALIRNNGALLEENIPVSINIYRQDPIKGWVETETKNLTVKANRSDFAELNTDFAFNVETYAELDEVAPRAEFYGMEENVTPLYKVAIKVGYDQYSDNNLIEQVYRFYVRRAEEFKIIQSNPLMIPDPETATDLATYSAAKNAQVLMTSMKEIDLYNVSRQDAEANKLADKKVDIAYRQNVDFFNRNAWPERSTNYSIYKTVVLADGDQTTLSRFEKASIINFLNSGDETHKKNLMLSSEEIVRNQHFNHWKKGIDLDLDLNEALHVEPRYPYSPLGKDKQGAGGIYADYSNKTVTGVSVGGHEVFEVNRTNNSIDMYPMPGLFNLVNSLDGKVYTAYKYNTVENPDFPEGARIMGGVYSSVDKNVTVLGVDWRHFPKVGDIFKANIDFMNRHGGMVNPVELYSFTADAVGNKVELLWSTASENNSERFEIERSADNEFIKIDEVKANGNSNVISYYNAVDAKVKAGTSYTYRLKMVDKDGSFDYSNEVTVKVGGKSMTISEINPNPVVNSSIININTAEAANISIDIYNEAGVKVLNIFNGNLVGSQDIEINSSNLSSGTYIVVISNGDNTIRRKMTVVK